MFQNSIRFLLAAAMVVGFTQESYGRASCQQLLQIINSATADTQTTTVSGNPRGRAQVTTTTRAPRARDNRTPVEKFKEVKIDQAETQQINQIVKTYNIAEFKDIADLTVRLAEVIKTKNKTQIQKSDELAKISDRVYKVLEQRLVRFFETKEINRSQSKIYNFTKEDIVEYVNERMPNAAESAKKARVQEIKKEYDDIRLDLMKAKYNFGEQIAKIEQFKIEEYQEAGYDHPLTQPDYTFVSLKEYPAFAMALAKDKAPPKPYGEGGVVSLREYRDVVSTNLWLFTLEGHDLKHIHFANSHPMAAASLFRLTRSKNHVRYFLIAALYEGVDTVQYSFESAIARHFADKGYTLEQAMIHLASAPQAELRQIATKIGKNPDYGDSDFDGWIPSKVPADKLPTNAKSPELLEQDILDFMEKSLKDLADPAKNIYMRPELIPDGIQMPAGTYEKPGDEIHYW